MKINKFQIRLIIGIIFVIIIYSLILFLEPKKNSNDNIKNNSKNNEKNQTNFISMENIETMETEKDNREISRDVTKEEIFSLIEKGLETPVNTEVFIYSTELFSGDNLSSIFFEGQYKDIIDYINLNEYRSDNFNFTTLRDTNSYIWGYFSKKDKEKYEKNFFLVDRSSGRIIALNSKNKHVVFCFNTKNIQSPQTMEKQNKLLQ